MQKKSDELRRIVTLSGNNYYGTIPLKRIVL